MDKEDFLAWAGGVAALGILATKKYADYVVSAALDREMPSYIAKRMGKVSGSPSAKDAALAEKQATAAQRLAGTPHTVVNIRSKDGLRLVGHWLECPRAKRVIVAAHGWHSSWTNDFALIRDFWVSQGCSVLYMEQRATGASEGQYLGFGMLESEDCRRWAYWADRKTEGKLPMYLCGVSMGSSTVLMTADRPMPKSMRGIMADCGFTSPCAIWQYILTENMHLPAAPKWALDWACRDKIGLSSRAMDTTKILRHSLYPVFFIHGVDDRFVPFSMTLENIHACKKPVTLVAVPGAGHGISYCVNTKEYQEKALRFWAQCEQ